MIITRLESSDLKLLGSVDMINEIIKRYNSYDSNQEKIKDLVEACKEAIRCINSLPKTSSAPPQDHIKEAVETLTHLQQAIGKAERE